MGERISYGPSWLPALRGMATRSASFLENSTRPSPSRSDPTGRLRGVSVENGVLALFFNQVSEVFDQLVASLHDGAHLVLPQVRPGGVSHFRCCQHPEPVEYLAVDSDQPVRP